jgi:hypothetical protein
VPSLSKRIAVIFIASHPARNGSRDSRDPGALAKARRHGSSFFTMIDLYSLEDPANKKGNCPV